MMADGPLLLNFAAGDIPSVGNRSKFKGGSWRNRLRLNKGSKDNTHERNSKGAHSGADAAYIRATRNNRSQNDEQNGTTQPTKRARPNGTFPSTLQKPQHDGTDRRDNVSSHSQRPDREIISSLFTYNPSPTVPQDELDQSVAHSEPAKPSNAPLPDGIDTFTSLGLSETVAAHILTKMSLKSPTAIQKAAISQIIREDADAFIQSETGSGKTLAYLLPLVQRLMTMAERQKHEMGDDQILHRESGLFAIILAPTRELCKQISVVLEKVLGCAHYIVAGTVIGGEKKKSEKARLRKGLNILVATPGRLVDHLENTRSLDVSHVRYLVLDEGDRLMDLGFEEDIAKILKNLDGNKAPSQKPGLPERRMTILCSATMRANVERLGDISLKDAVLVKGGADDAEAEGAGLDTTESVFLAPAQLKQSYAVVPAKQRLVTLAGLLRRTFARKGSVMKAIVFISCADSVDFHFQVFTRHVTVDQTSQDGQSQEQPNTAAVSEISDAIAHSPSLSSPTNPLTCYKLHGSLPQQTRTSIVKAFTASSTASLLIATDVASRGLDLPNLDLVIEHDPAFSKEDHLHRIGRTARLGRDGRAMIFLMPGSEEGYVKVLKSSYKVDTGSSNVSFTSSEDLLKKGFSSASGIVSSDRDWETKATDFQLDVERWVLSDTKNKDLAKNAFQSHVRAYATHIASERQYFDIKGLHLGHLAKAFGLRDPPGKVNVAGVGRKGQQSSRKANFTKEHLSNRDAAVRSNAKADIDDTTDVGEAAQRMRQMVRNKMKMMGAGADEFNIA